MATLPRDEFNLYFSWLTSTCSGHPRHGERSYQTVRFDLLVRFVKAHVIL